MGRCRYRCDVLALAVAAIASGCSDVDVGPTPQFIPVDQIESDLPPPEIQQTNAPFALPLGLRVVTYNTLFKLQAESVVAAAFTIDANLAKADVIALQESRLSHGDVLSDAGKLATAVGMGWVFVPLQEWSEGFEGIALLSRFPLRDVELMQLPDLTDAGLLDSAASRVVLAATVDTARGPIRIVNIHLQVNLNMPERVVQVRPGVLDPTLPTVALGDFNTNDYIWAVERIPLLPQHAAADTSQADALDDYMRGIGYATPTADFGSTWHGFPADQRLDSIFTFELTTGAGRVERGVGFSDHWPVWLDVALPASEPTP